MPTTSHEEILSRGVDVWNEWRTANPTVQPMLAKMDFGGASLSETGDILLVPETEGRIRRFEQMA